MSHYEELSADQTRGLLFSLRWYVKFVLQSRTRLRYSEFSLEVFGVGTRLAMPKTICAPDSSSLKPGSGATEGVLDKGVSGQPDYMLWPDCWTMKIQRLKTSSRVRMGLFFAWKASLAIRMIDLLLCNRLCVTLAPSGVYIKRRV